MSGVLKINITESPESLKTLLAQQKTASGKERVQALCLLTELLLKDGNLYNITADNIAIPYESMMSMIKKVPVLYSNFVTISQVETVVWLSQMILLLGGQRDRALSDP